MAVCVPAAWGQSLRNPAAAHYDVVALRVEFQPDTTRFTTGDGTFDGVLFEDGLAPSIDPLPHDAAYFEAHLAFLADYVATVSDGQTQVTTHLVPDVVRVSKSMGAYSPTGFEADGDAELSKLAGLVAEAWTTADARGLVDLSGFDPERTAFVLFHAGVGRDIELLGTLLDKTPQDLPSIVFDAATLERLGAGDVRVDGLPLRHTLLIPRTESRPGFNFIEDAPFLLELSTNGLLAASFFNFLGVPDLFDTDTGDPAIGPFGLMDPLGIFAYNGLFPPEPSAWTKYYLGWTEPVDLAGHGPETVSLGAVGLPDASPVARAFISPAEYFLVENRHRDPEGDGLVLRVWQRGEIVEQQVQNGDEDFTRFDVSGFVGGVVVGADTYDWALPGGLDSDGNTLDGGILIWHVDERRILDGSVNRDPERRAVDLEEADSAQDLGFPQEGLFGSNADQGTPFDFFYEGNPVSVELATRQVVSLYQNRFGPDTYPNSHANEGGASFLVLDAFSPPGVTMTFTYRREGAEGITPLEAYTQRLEWGDPLGPSYFNAGTGLSGQEGVGLIGFATRRTLAETPEGTIAGEVGILFRLDAQGRHLGTASGHRPYAKPAFFGTTLVTLGPERYQLWRGVDSEQGIKNIMLPEPAVLKTFRGGPEVITPVIAIEESNTTVLYTAFTEPGNSLYVRAPVEADEGEAVFLDGDEVVSLAKAGDGQVAVVGRRGTQVRGGAEAWAYAVDAADSVGQAVFGRDIGGLVGVVPIVSDHTLLWLLPGGSVQRVDLATYASVLPGDEAELSRLPVLADVDDDGRLDVLATYGRYLVAFTQGGALVRDFPVALSAPSLAQPLVAELSESGAWSVVVASTDGYVYAYDLGTRARQVAGFPLAVGRRVEATPLLQDGRLYAVSVDGDLRAWTLDRLGRVWWGTLHADAQNHSYVEHGNADLKPGTQPGGGSGGLIVEAETYNWPNPVRAGQTYLRCLTTEDASVRITIVDAAGTLVDEVDLDVRGGTPAEHLWQTTAGSGLYYARVSATGVSGDTASTLIKMAVIR